MSQAELAEKVGVSQAAIGQWERGEFMPRGRNLNAMAELLGPGLTTQQLREHTGEIVELPNPDETEAAPDDAKVRLKNAEHRSKSREFEIALMSLLQQREPTMRTKVLIDAPTNGSRIVDILTHRSVIDIKHPTSYDQSETQVIQLLWRLTVMRALMGKGRNYIGVVRRPPQTHLLEEVGTAYAFSALDFYDHRLRTLAAEANLVGIELVVAETPEEAAKAIEEIESRPA